MRVSTLMFSDNYIPQLNQLQGEQQQLQNQATTGLAVTQPEDNPGVMDEVLNLQNTAAANNQYQTNISKLQGTAANVSNALTTLQPLIEQANTIALNASNTATGTTELADDATQIASIIQQALQIANTTDANGDYLFAGTNTGSQPFTAATDSNGNVTSVAYSGNTTVNNVAISPNLSVSAQIPGANSTASGPSGLFSDSQSGADLFNHLIQLQQNLTAASAATGPARATIQSNIQANDLSAIQKDEDHVTTQIGANGVLQSTLENASSSATQANSTVSTQISNASSANLAETLTKLSQTQTAYQAALESGVTVMKLSILDYLG